MTPNPLFTAKSPEFWAYVRSVSEVVGYAGKATSLAASHVKAADLDEIIGALAGLGLSSDDVIDTAGVPTKLGQDLVDYFRYRADVINGHVHRSLMNADEAAFEFWRLYMKLKPKCRIPQNKQKGAKKAPAYFTGIINMLVEANSLGMPVNLDPQKFTAFELNGKPFRTLSRRVDGCFPTTLNPIAIWEVKEYYYTTSFGSRVADGIYEAHMDGLELLELRAANRAQNPSAPDLAVTNLLMIDAKDNWWKDGKSYLCKIIDLLHFGSVSEALFGREVLDRLPLLVQSWVRTTTWRPFLGYR